MLSYAVVDEVTPLHEVDGGILLGCLSLAGSLDIRRHLPIPWVILTTISSKSASGPAPPSSKSIRFGSWRRKHLQSDSCRASSLRHRSWRDRIARTPQEAEANRLIYLGKRRPRAKARGFLLMQMPRAMSLLLSVKIYRRSRTARKNRCTAAAPNPQALGSVREAVAKPQAAVSLFARTFAMYFKEPREATDRDLDFAATIARTAVIAMSRPHAAA